MDIFLNKLNLGENISFALYQIDLWYFKFEIPRRRKNINLINPSKPKRKITFPNDINRVCSLYPETNGLLKTNVSSEPRNLFLPAEHLACLM